MQVVLLIGIQATGKSSFCKRELFDTHLRINLDMLKTRNREKQLFELCLALKQRVVIDNTNPTEADRARYIAPAKAAGFEVVGYYFESKISDALQRNAARSRVVPERGVRAAASRLMVPRYGEGFDLLHHVRLSEEGFLVSHWTAEDD